MFLFNLSGFWSRGFDYSSSILVDKYYLGSSRLMSLKFNFSCSKLFKTHTKPPSHIPKRKFKVYFHVMNIVVCIVNLKVCVKLVILYALVRSPIIYSKFASLKYRNNNKATILLQSISMYKSRHDAQFSKLEK